ncbi:MAG: YvcK family protein [Candidatus Omnitrophica bacterium]|nr:YvcK family protein [Candidatus Omnitrophota bacterium]
MRKLKWLYPGMLVKRWISLSVFGIVMISMGFVIVISERSPENKALAGLIITLGIMCMIFAVKRILRSLMTVLAPREIDSTLVDKIYAKRILEKGPKIVVVGGGTGLSTLLTGLKHRTSNIAAIVTVADDGGSSGRLREEFDILPPGDIRNCLVALSDSEDLLGALFQFRFSEGKELKDHNFGNLFITALSKVTGDFARAIRESSKVLAIRGDVFPATLQKVKLVAKREDGREIIGESRVHEEKGSPIDRIGLIPGDCRATPESIKAIRAADMIILGPGSLYTSVIPNLLIKGIRDEIVRSRAIKVYICNVMTEAGETDNYSISDHVRAIIKHTSPGIVDYCIGNVMHIPPRLYEQYQLKEQYPVRLDEKDEKWFRQERITLVKAQVAGMKGFVRHDPVKLTDAAMSIFNA